jgi:hypothetical protein
MKPWRDDESKDQYKKRSKRASNRPGEGMRLINSFVEEDVDDYNDIEFDDGYDFSYNDKQD